MTPAVCLNDDDTIAFIGDSITDAEKHRRAYHPLGFGYVHFAANFLRARHPNLTISIINAGVGGDTIIDLQNRWQRDCLAHRPNVPSVLVGINDVCRLTTEPAFAENAAAPETFEVTYNQLLSQARQMRDVQLVLMEPSLFCDNRQPGRTLRCRSALRCHRAETGGHVRRCARSAPAGNRSSDRQSRSRALGRRRRASASPGARLDCTTLAGGNKSVTQCHAKFFSGRRYSFSKG